MEARARACPQSVSDQCRDPKLRHHCAHSDALIRGNRVFASECGQRTTFSTLNNAIFNDHPRDAAGAELARAYYGRRLRSELSKGDIVVVGGVALAVASVGWRLVRGDFDEVRGGDGPGAAAPRCGASWPVA